MHLLYTSLFLSLLHTVSAAPQEAPPTSTTLGQTPTTLSQTSMSTALQTGFFRAQGSYDITSISGYYLVAGYTLSEGGPNQLVGGVRVTAALDGFYADGTSIALEQYTSESLTSTSTSPSPTPTVDLTTVSGGTQTPSTAGGAVATAKVGVAVLGGVVGVLLL